MKKIWQNKELVKNALTALCVLVAIAILLIWAFDTSDLRDRENYNMSPDEYSNNPALTLGGTGELEKIEITPENLATYVKSATVPNNTLWIMTHYDAQSNITYTFEYRAKDGKERVDCYSDGQHLYYYIFSKESTIYYSAEKGYRETLNLKNYDALAYAQMDALDVIAKTRPQSITSLKQTALLGQEMLVVEFANSQSGESCKCWISTKTGMPIVYETYKNGLRAKHTTTVSYEIDVADPIIFK